jgi:amidase
VALKDNIALAGVPMMNGASTLEGFVPAYDATVATRLLDAGATILGKATCEHFCLSGGSHTSDPAPCTTRCVTATLPVVLPPAAPRWWRREVDMAIGCDQGVYPYSFRLLRHLWHETDPRSGALHGHHADRSDPRPCGPITANVRDNALMLEVIAGATGWTRVSMLPP